MAKRTHSINGYRAFYDPDHPLANASGIVYVHREVVSRKLGRWLTSAECVHHKDGNRANNDPDNLVVTTLAEHSRHHGLKEKVKLTCPECGIPFETVPSHRDRRRCCSRDCQQKRSRKVEWPSRKDLKLLLQENSVEAVGRKFGVSGNAVRKWMRKYGLMGP